MLPTCALLRARLRAVIDDKEEQGHVVDRLSRQLDSLPDSYDALADFAALLAGLPLRPAREIAAQFLRYLHVFFTFAR